MPLHLLGKKSWNVYNADNIAKVKRDEAAAATREQAEEQRMQEVDAERRIQILRGIKIDPLPAAKEEGKQELPTRERQDGPGPERKRRRIVGEDETDREIRFAQEDKAIGLAKLEIQTKSRASSDAPLVDRQGHINLFPVDGSKIHAPKNAEVEAEKAKKQKEFEDQYTMRFSNAAGFKQAVGQKPWYHSAGAISEESSEVPSKDVWGNEDPRRKEREKARIAADDPLAAMQKGVAGVRQVEQERKRWKEEKDREIREIDEEERHKERRRMKRKKQEEDTLEGFSLDAPALHKRGHHHHHRKRYDASKYTHR